MSPAEGSTRIAVIDLGTNSTRLLVTDVRGRDLDETDRRTTVTRLGEGVDETGELSDVALERVFEALTAYGTVIDHLGAERVVAIATSAVRDAANGERFLAELHARFGIEAETISGDEEARLTFLGATAGRDPSAPVLVIDIGGGSTEFVIGEPGSPPRFHVSTALGSVRQTERHLHDDPPRPEQLEQLLDAAGAVVEAAVPAEVRARVPAAIAVAGTATSLAAADQRLDPYDPDRVHGYALTAEGCERMFEQLAELPLGRRREVVGLHPDRAPTIIAGVGILVAAMRAFGLDVVEVSEADILHGAALDAAAASGAGGLA